MLTPNYLDTVAEKIMPIVADFEETVLRRIVEQLIKTDKLHPSSVYRAEQLQHNRMFLEDIMLQVAKLSNYSLPKIKEIFLESGVESLKFENSILEEEGLPTFGIRSPALQRAINIGVERTHGEVRNFTRTTAVNAQDLLYEHMDKAYYRLLNGTSIEASIRDSIKELSKVGLSRIYYDKNGYKRRDHIDVAVRRAVQTGVNQTSAAITNIVGVENDAPYRDTSAHEGAREEHEKWQGKRFLWVGSNENYENFHEATRFGKVDGLCGANCRHNFHIAFEGTSLAYSQGQLEEYKTRTVPYNGEKMLIRDARALQRKFERSIRELKREKTMLKQALPFEPALQDEYKKTSTRLSQINKQLKLFLEETGMKMDYSRVRI